MTHKVTKAEGFGEYRVTNESGAEVGTFYFSRSWTKGQVFTTCIVRPAAGDVWQPRYCYFKDVRRDAESGFLFSQ